MPKQYIKEVATANPEAGGTWRLVYCARGKDLREQARKGHHVVQTASVDGYISILEAEIKALRERSTCV